MELLEAAELFGRSDGGEWETRSLLEVAHKAAQHCCRRGVAAILMAHRNHRHAGPDNLVDVVGDLLRQFPLGDTAGHPRSDAKPLLDVTK